jgi:tubulin polyglutamylase TTLL6/13
MHEICRKDYLARNLSRLSRLFPRDYNFFPKTWILPNDFVDFKQVAATQKNMSYIAKPDQGCQGKGIFLFRKSSQILNCEGGDMDNMIVQNYLSRPLLIDGYKFDLRGLCLKLLTHISLCTYHFCRSTTCVYLQGRASKVCYRSL